MNVFTPDIIMKNAQYDSHDGKIAPDNIVFKMQRQSNKFYLENLNAIPKDEDYDQIIDFVENSCEIVLSSQQVRELIDLYPRTRILVACDGVQDTHVRDEISFAISHFFLGCPWPTYGDKIDINSFIKYLKSQAEMMGFSIIKEETTT